MSTASLPDKIGLLGTSLCLLHCAALPFMLLLLPASLHTIGANYAIDAILLATCAWAVFQVYKRPTATQFVKSMLLLGLAFMAIHMIADALDVHFKTISYLGALALIIGHVGHLRHCKICNKVI